MVRVGVGVVGCWIEVGKTYRNVLSIRAQEKVDDKICLRFGSDPEKQMRGMVALEPNFPRAVFMSLSTDHLKSFLKLSPLHILPPSIYL